MLWIYVVIFNFVEENKNVDLRLTTINQRLTIRFLKIYSKVGKDVNNFESLESKQLRQGNYCNKLSKCLIPNLTSEYGCILVIA